MKFQNPSMNFFERTDGLTDRLKPIFSPHFFFGTIKQVFLPCISVALKISVSSLQWRSLQKMLTGGL